MRARITVIVLGMSLLLRLVACSTPYESDPAGPADSGAAGSDAGGEAGVDGPCALSVVEVLAEADTFIDEDECASAGDAGSKGARPYGSIGPKQRALLRFAPPRSSLAMLTEGVRRAKATLVLKRELACADQGGCPSSRGGELQPFPLRVDWDETTADACRRAGSNPGSGWGPLAGAPAGPATFIGSSDWGSPSPATTIDARSAEVQLAVDGAGFTSAVIDPRGERLAIMVVSAGASLQVATREGGFPAKLVIEGCGL